MMESPISRATGRVAAAVSALAAAALVLVGGAAAQSVAFSEYGVSVRSFSGITVVDLGAQGFGTGARLTLRDADGTLRADLMATTADLFLGGGDDDGDIVLRDTDGVTTTVNLQGEFGFVQLGSPEEDGDLRLWDNDPVDEFSINLDGATGNVTNQLAGNGLVKAWARVNASGDVVACWRCDIALTYRDPAIDGLYNVSFSPLGDIRSRPRLAVIDKHDYGITTGQVTLSHGFNGSDTVAVETTTSGGTRVFLAFTVFIF